MSKQITIRMPKRFCRQTLLYFNETGDRCGCFYGEFATQAFGQKRIEQDWRLQNVPDGGVYGEGSDFQRAMISAHCEAARSPAKIRRAKFREVCKRYGVKVIG